MLTKVSNNSLPTTYIELREVRKKYFRINQSKSQFTYPEHQESEDIRKLLGKLKVSHPELCSKEDFIKSEEFKQLRNGTQHSETTVDNNASKNMFASFYASQSHQKNSYFTQPSSSGDKNSAQKPTGIETKKRDDKSRDKKSELQNIHKEPPVAAGEDEEELSEEEIVRKIQQYMLWARELRDVMTQQQRPN